MCSKKSIKNVIWPKPPEDLRWFEKRSQILFHNILSSGILSLYKSLRTRWNTMASKRISKELQVRRKEIVSLSFSFCSEYIVVYRDYSFIWVLKERYGCSLVDISSWRGRDGRLMMWSTTSLSRDDDCGWFFLRYTFYLIICVICRICKGIHRRLVVPVRLEMICFTGKRPLWVQGTVHTAVVCFLWRFTFLQIILSSLQRSSSKPRCIIQILTAKVAFVLIFWKNSGVQLWPYQKCSCPSALC